MKPILQSLDELFRHAELFKGKAPDYIMLSTDRGQELTAELLAMPHMVDCCSPDQKRTTYRGVPVLIHPHYARGLTQIGWGEPFLTPAAKRAGTW